MMHERAIRRAGLPHLVAVVSAALVFAGGASWGTPLVNSAHDFVAHGFTGGGVCTECHVPHSAKELRLYPRDVGAVGVFDGTVTLFCKDCHKDASPVLPAGSDWTAVIAAGITPPANPHGADVRFASCTTCHPHSRAFAPPPNDECLSCHTALGVAGILDPSFNIDKYFDGIGDANTLILSQHNIYYRTDGNLDTYEPFWPVAAGGNANECKKCHGDKAEDGVALHHPSATVRTETTGARVGKLRSVFLAYSAATGNAILPAYARNDVDKRTYEPFCLNCHQGKTRASTPVSEKFGGPVPAQQVGPTERTNPATQQAAPTPPTSGWIVAAVPPKDGQLASPFLNADPDGTALKPFYFAYYSTNGHGAVNSLIQTPVATMDRTCVSGSSISIDGCHVVHGSQNRFLLDDTGSPFAQGLKTATQVGTGVCMATDCHLARTRFVLPPVAGKTTSTFHGWWNTTPESVLHDSSPLGGVGQPSAEDGMAQWRIYGTGNMNISASPVPPLLDGLLPFYAGLSANIEARTYPAATLSNANWLHCLTCHDPHGAGPNTQPGMLRHYDNVMTYTSSLCGECHVE